MEIDLRKLNATQLARIYVTLKELGRNEDAVITAITGVNNCGRDDWKIEVDSVIKSQPVY